MLRIVRLLKLKVKAMISKIFNFDIIATATTVRPL